MKIKSVILILLFLLSTVSCQDKSNSKEVDSVKELKSDLEKYSYAIGVDMGMNLKNQYIDVELLSLMKGIKDGMEGDEWLMSEEEFMATVERFQAEQQVKYQQKRTEEANKNKETGEKFLAENKTKEGVTTLPSGLQYRVIKTGNGPSPKEDDNVTAHYAGRLIDGTEFDSSVKRGQPFTTPVNRVIKGWTEVLQLMKVGDKWEVFIPSELAYGERGSGAKIGPNQVLIFEMELLGIEGK